MENPLAGVTSTCPVVTMVIYGFSYWPEQLI